jgi:hypothetical protein
VVRSVSRWSTARDAFGDDDRLRRDAATRQSVDFYCDFCVRSDSSASAAVAQSRRLASACVCDAPTRRIADLRVRSC